MAPPNNRRPGFSRRAQYSTFVAYLIATAGVLLGGFLLVTANRNSASLSGIRSAATDLAAVPAAGAASIRSWGGQWLGTLSGYLASGSEVAALRKEVQVARIKQVEAAALRDENRRLKTLLEISGTDGKPVAVARLVGSSLSSTRRFATLGAGAMAGIRPGMPVRSELGLVGRVLEVGAVTSRVLLVTDSDSVVPVRRATDGVAAFATGRGDGNLQIRLVSLGLNPLKPGDTLVTSGSGGLYRPGVAMALITRLTADGAIARPLGNPTSAELVMVEQEWVAEAAMAPANPAAAARPDSAQARTGN